MNKKNILKILVSTTITMAVANKIISIISNINNSFNKKNYLTYKNKIGTIQYKKYGSGSPLILVHNLSVGDNINEWNYIIEHLEKHHTVYCINLPGCGNSEKNHIIYTNFMYVKLLNDFINEIISSKTDIVTSGNSNEIAIMTEKYNPNIIGKIIMINPAEQFSYKKYYNVIGKIINLPIVGTFIYNCIFNKKSCLKDTKNNFRLKEYMNTYYDSIHYKNNKSKFLYTSIIQGKTFINHKLAYKNLTKKPFTYKDNKYIYPHIQTPEKVAKYILSI